MLADDEEDAEGLGEIGFLSERLKDEAFFWRTVITLRLPLREVDSWTLGEMRIASSYQQMVNDYKRIWSSYYELKKESIE